MINLSTKCFLTSISLHYPNLPKYTLNRFSEIFHTDIQTYLFIEINYKLLNKQFWDFFLILALKYIILIIRILISHDIQFLFLFQIYQMNSPFTSVIKSLFSIDLDDFDIHLMFLFFFKYKKSLKRFLEIRVFE